MTKKTKTKNKKSRRSRLRRSKRGFGIKGLIFILLLRLVLSSLFVGAVLVMYLDIEVRKYSGGVFEVAPARIYSRPLVFKTGLSYSLSELEKNLKQRGYTATTRLTTAGQYVLRNNVADIYVRAYNDGFVAQSKRALRLKFSGTRLVNITNHQNGKDVSQFYLSPLEIGRLQRGSAKDRVFLRLHEMPESLIQSLLTMEDRKFELHSGVDVVAIARAVLTNLSGGSRQGGSTITQQLVKNLFLAPTQTLSRKALEAVLSLALELRFSKAQILEMYLNEIFLGQSGNIAIHGFPLASQFFFGKPIQQLGLQEVATLVGIVPAPSFYNPFRHPERALKRRNLVLSVLASNAIISKQRADTLSQLPLGVVPYRSLSNSEYSTFIDYMHRQLKQYYSDDVLRTGGLKLYSSMDVITQQVAQQQLSASLNALETERKIDSNTLQGAVVVIDINNGDILALVGDRRKGYFGFNRAVDAERPIGSLIKPAVYLSALTRNRYSLATPLSDRPLTVTTADDKEWSPQNYDKEYRGDVLLYQALINSYNVPAVRLGLDVGVENVIKTMRQLGISREVKPFPSLLLGAGGHSVLEMGQMYQTIANQGERYALRSIHSVKNKSEQVVAKFPLRANRAVRKEHAYLIDYALQLVTQQGTARRLNTLFDSRLHLAGKTGTTNDFRDSWYAGYVGNILTVVWVGRDDNKPAGLTGSSGAMRVWANIMANLSLQPSEQTSDKKIKLIKIDNVTGALANNKCPDSIVLPFVRGSEPTAFAPCSGITGKLVNFFKSDNAFNENTATESINRSSISGGRK